MTHLRFPGLARKVIWSLALLALLLMPAQVTAQTSVPDGTDASFQVVYNPSSCTTAVTPWDSEAKTAFDAAAARWGALLATGQTLRIHACWAVGLSPGLLGSAGSTGLYRNFPGAPRSDILYPVALANALAGADLNEADGFDSDQDGSDADAEIQSMFNSEQIWYFGTDGNVPKDQIEFFSVVLHEIGHGLGFSGQMTVQGNLGKLRNPLPGAYDYFTEDVSGVPLLNTGVYPNESTALGAVLQSGAVFFDGPAAVANAGGRVPLYAPATWLQGSSYSHLNESFIATPEMLMMHEQGLGVSALHPGWVALGMLQDMGWEVKDDGGPVPFLDVRVTEPLLVAAGSDNVSTTSKLKVFAHRPDALWQVQAASRGGWLAATAADASGNGQVEVVTTGTLGPGYYPGQVTVRLVNSPALEEVVPLNLFVPGDAHTDDRILEGDFEATPSSWQVEAPTGGALVGAFTINGQPAARSGTRSGLLGLGALGTLYNVDAALAQTIKLPGSGPITLVYHLLMLSYDLCGHDFAQVTVNDTVLAKVDLCWANSSTGWQANVLDLDAFAGQEVTVRFRIRTDESRASYALVDDVALFVPESGTAQLTASPTALAFAARSGSGAPVPQTLSIGNAGGGSLVWQAVVSEAWLAAVPANGNGTAVLQVSVDSAGLAPGNYQGQITITSEGALGSPLDVPVTLQVNEAGDVEPAVFLPVIQE